VEDGDVFLLEQVPIRHADLAGLLLAYEPGVARRP
jgi:hypothetical protein